jgi:hypothetical protein
MVVIDLSRASTDAAGSGKLTCAVARAEKRGQHVPIALTNAMQLEVLRAAGLDSAIPVVRSEPEALRLLARNPVTSSARGATRNHPAA